MTKTQKEILQHLANGKKRDEIPALVKKGSTSVSVDILAVKSELRASTTTHAVANAIRENIIK